LFHLLGKVINRVYLLLNIGSEQVNILSSGDFGIAYCTVFPRITGKFFNSAQLVDGVFQ